MEEVRVDLRIPDEAREKEMKRSSELCFKINHTMPTSPECRKLIEELFNNNLDNLKKLLFTMIERIPTENNNCECANTRKNSQL